MINVTKAFLPPFDEYTSILKRAWDKAWITNNGELVQELEAKLKDYLGVKHLFYTNNGTIVLQMALKALNITKEVITTPFSYVATTNAIIWEGCTPVFVDIDKTSLCIDANKIEEAINEKTEAILATHVFGIPCNIDKIKNIAAKFNLKVIYDGAHAFGSTYNDRSLLSYGDISTCSFHATKIFHSVEGGCIITDNDDLAEKLMLFRQFGHVNDNYYSVGINAKNSEFHAAMGLCVYNNFSSILENRKQIFSWYKEYLIEFNLFDLYNNLPGFIWNYSYVPVVLESEEKVINVIKELNKQGVFPRRYFYPSLNQLSFVNSLPCVNSEDISKRILCLPTFFELKKNEVYNICKTINNIC